MIKAIPLLALAISAFPFSLIAQDYDTGLQAAKSGNFSVAITEWEPLAETGNVKAQLGLATIFLKGMGVE